MLQRPVLNLIGQDEAKDLHSSGSEEVFHSYSSKRDEGFFGEGD